MALLSRTYSNSGMRLWPRILIVQRGRGQKLLRALCTSVHSSNKMLPAKDYITWSTENAVKIQMEDSIPGNYAPILVQDMMKQVSDKYGDSVAVVSFDGDIKWTYKEYYSEVQKAAKGFVSLGLTPSHGVGIMGNNHPYCLASIFAGGLSCGIYTTNTASTVSYICQHAPIDILVVEDMAMLQLLLSKQDLAEVKAFVVMTGEVERGLIDSATAVLTWKELLDRGHQLNDEALVERQRIQAVNKACMLIYTSGTTGPPKGAMLSHDNVTWSSRVSMEHYEWNQEKLLSYLPLSHVAACLIDCYMIMYVGGEVHFADKNALKGTLVENLKRVRPTKFLGVPRVWEKIAEKMQEVGKSNKGLKKAIGDWAKATATEHHTLVRQGRRDPYKPSLSYRLAKKLVFSKIHEALGLNEALKTDVPTSSSAAPLNLDTFYYFQSLDIVVTELLGSTETSGPQTTNMAGPLCRPGSAGRSYFGVTNKILNQDETGHGEIGTRSRNVFMGYQKDEAKTKEAFQDGYFKSGDLGKIDQDGFMWMSGRLKELLITAGGENIAPIPIENNIIAQMPDLLSYVVVVGDQRKHLSVLLTLKCLADPVSGLPTDKLDPSAIIWCETHVPGCHVNTINDVSANKDLGEVITSFINKANDKSVANPQRVQKYTILSQDLSIQGGELGPTLKLKRHVIVSKYSDLIDLMYKV